MTFSRYLRLKKLALKVRTFESFTIEVIRKSWWYGIPFWNKEQYRNLYDRLKKGNTYKEII